MGKPAPPVQDPLRLATGADRAVLSVIINNYNYARFLRTTIDSVLAQTVAVELIVVDDCSTDNSRDVIASYGDRLIPVLQPVNQGQGAGFNAGFAHATGQLVMFLDADDFLLPGAGERILANRQRGVSLYLYPMRYADADGRLGGLFPGRPFSQGDVSGLLRSRGRYDGTITSGMVFDRVRMMRYMPMDPEAFRYGGDGHVATAAPLYGRVFAGSEPISAYRLHGGQHTSRAFENLARMARWRLTHDAERYKVLREHAARLGLQVAGDLGAQDELNNKERLISLLCEPGRHPVPGETAEGLIRHARRLTLDQRRGLYRYLRAAWWTLLLHAPATLRLKLFLYEVSPATRPAIFAKSVRLLKSARRLTKARTTVSNPAHASRQSDVGDAARHNSSRSRPGRAAHHERGDHPNREGFRG